MPVTGVLRFGAICGVILALSIGIPGVIEIFIGETTLTSFVIGLGAVCGAPVVTAFHLHQGAAAGRLGGVAYIVNTIGLSLFGGLAFALNLVVFFLPAPVTKSLLAGPTGIAQLVSVATFVIGTGLYSASMLRAKVFPRLPSAGYGISLILLAVFAALPDTPLTGLVHVLAAGSLIWLSMSLLRAPAPRSAPVLGGR
ncbi:hypothetical protein [Sinosporangium siamense]|uniref:Uncharacterized protein n=1 Tax=Sinosporangium siamense TaxID=1367973 RepID=A0A919RIA1_9ACTN|nr:hypothetical protein [Sinosporangium siamense]GII94148.1 hypothetical protein Ssi02_43790 [Sinosporangium siamense]